MICNGNDPKQRAFVRELINNGLDRLINDPRAKMIGATDKGTFEWLWHKYTKAPWGARDITKTDVKRFNRGLSTYLDSIGKTQNWIQRNFYLPKRLTGKSFYGGRFIKGIGEAASYHQRLMKEGSRITEDMIGGLYDMMIDKQSPIYQQRGRALTKNELKEFNALEKELWLTPRSIDAQKHDNIMTQLTEMAGWNVGEGTKGVTYAGEVLKRYQGLLDFSISTNITPTEQKILNKWSVLRADMMKALINTGITQKRIAQTLNNPVERDFIVRAIDKIQEQVDALLIQGNIDMKRIKAEDKQGWVQSWENGLDVIDPRTGKIEKYKVKDPETGEMVIATGVKKYFPKLVLEMTDIMANVMKFSQSRERDGYNKLTAEQLEQVIIEDLQPGNVTKRLQQAADNSKYWSLDPVHYLTKYVHDVASSNFRARINLAYVDGIKSLVEASRKANTGSTGSIEIADYANEMINTMSQIRDSALNNYKGGMTEVDQMVRLINGFEYIAKLGFSLKSGLKNRTQGLWNWIEFGSMGYFRSHKFYKGTDRPFDPTIGETEVTNKGMMHRQLRRMGMLMGEKGDAASISAATGGSLDAVVVPKGFTLNEKGALVHASKTSIIERSANSTAWLADLSSKYSLWAAVPGLGTHGLKGKGSQQWAENKNRLSTFKMSFAHAFMLEQNRYDHWKNKLSKKGTEPTEAQIYDAMENAAGNAAQEMVKKLHYDYDNWAKAAILQGKVGKTVGQFQHFKFAFFDLNYRLVRDAVNDVKDFNIIETNPYTGGKRINENFQQMSRMSMIYTMLGGLAAYALDVDIGGVFSSVGYQPGTREDEGKFISGSRGGLIDNPILEETTKLIDYLGADRGDGSKENEEKLYGSYFGKGPLIANLGPFISDLFTVAELFDFLNLTSDQYARRHNLNYEPSSWEWRYQIARIFNVAGARTAWHTIPALLRGDIPQAIRIETGLYKPRWISKWAAQSKRDIAEKIGYTAKGFFKKDPFVKQKKYEAKKRKKDKESVSKRDVLHSLDRIGQ